MSTPADSPSPAPGGAPNGPGGVGEPTAAPLPPAPEVPVAGQLPPPVPVAPPPVPVAPPPVPARSDDDLRTLRRLAGVMLFVVGACLGSVVTLIATDGGSDGAPAARPSASSVASPSQAGAAPAGSAAEPRNTVQGGIVVGDPQAPVQLRVYEDYLCPFCAEFEKENAEQIERWIAAGTVSVDYRTVSILDQASSTAYSTRAAMASAAVRDAAPQAWPAFHAALFANQPPEGGAGLSDGALADLAAQAGAPRDAVLGALADRRFARWVEAVTQSAGAGPDRLEGTPTVVLVDRKAQTSTQVGDWARDELKAAVEAAIPSS